MNVLAICVLLVALIASNLAAWFVVFTLNQKLLDTNVQLGDLEFQMTSRMNTMQSDLDFFSLAVLKGMKERENKQTEE